MEDAYGDGEMSGRSNALWALAAAAGTVAWVVLYLSVVSAESDGSSARSVFVALFLLTTAVTVIVGSFLKQPLLRVALPSAAAVGQFAWAGLGILSLGVPLLLPAALSAVVATLNAATEQAVPALAGAIIGTAGSLLIVGLGLALTPGAP